MSMNKKLMELQLQADKAKKDSELKRSDYFNALYFKALIGAKKERNLSRKPLQVNAPIAEESEMPEPKPEGVKAK